MMAVIAVVLTGGAADAAEWITSVDGEGRATVSTGGEVLLAGLGLRLAPPGWRGDYRTFDVARQEEPGRVIVTGKVGNSEHYCEFRAETRPAADRVICGYDMTAKTTVPLETLRLDGQFPQEGNRGQATWFVFEGPRTCAGVFPAELGGPLDLGTTTAEAIGWVSPSGQGLKIVPDWPGLTEFYAQDARA
jgi:hypothetical protein